MNEASDRSGGSMVAAADEELTSSEPRQLVDHFFRHEYAKLVATLTRKFGVRHWELVEDVVQSALERALNSWSLRGVPENPTAWLHRVASNLALDTLRRDSRWYELDSRADIASKRSSVDSDADELQLQDDMLRMFFVCCDPEVPAESQVALALKTLCGFGNLEIARALLATEVSVAKRVTRAKQKLRESGVEPADLTPDSLSERLPDVQAVVYLLFNEGYSSSIADKLIREELCEEAVRLALVLAEHPQTRGPRSAALLALLLFHAARLDARIDKSGAMLLLKEQDRSLWDHRLLLEAFRWFRLATSGDDVTRYHAEAWIAAEHCRAASISETNWERIAAGYDVLCSLESSPVHELSRAIAIGHRDGPEAGLEAFSAIKSDKLKKDYYLWHATRAELMRQTGDIETAKTSLRQAWKLAPTNAEKELICRKLDELSLPE
ncbi:MAG: sigma-70 family RNA polymerase sigma factor [Planctomycetes bacterium]|nr:sigma-70 family RNA polymerase sigma factor [Planctomycetota bacterium]